MNFTFLHYSATAIFRRSGLPVIISLLLSLHTSAQIYYSNFVTSTGNYSATAPGGTLCLSPGFTNPANAATADLTDYTNVTGLLSATLTCNTSTYSIRAKLNLPSGVTQAPAGYTAGFRARLNTVLSLAVLQNNMSLQTYQGGTQAQNVPGTSLLGLDLLALGNTPADISFVSSAPFDEVELTFNTALLPIGALFDYRFYYAFGTASLLPVKLTAFTAATQNRNVTLNWTTASQSGVSRYEVQRSSGTDQYATIAVIDATADKHGSVNYSYTDKTAVDGAYTYRLKIVDQDESVEYSKVVLAGALSSVPYKIYPTHVIRGQNIQIISADTGSADASLMDVSGKMIGNYKMKNSLSIPTDQLRQGLYLIKISGEGKNIPVQKIVVQ